jgi:hypothetical protein
MTLRSDRLKKLETELADLEQWLKLGLVPKKDIEKHKNEIELIRGKIGEERERLQFLKESGETEEYTTPRRVTGRSGYTDTPTMPEIDLGEEPTGLTDMAMEADNDSFLDTTTEERGGEEEEAPTPSEEHGEEEEEEDPFSDRNRWKRGMLHSDDEW